MDKNIKRVLVRNDVMVDEATGRVLVSIELSPRVGRNKAVRVDSALVREWLATEKNLDVGVLISGSSIHNNMDRRLGGRSADDLKADFVFELNVKKPEPVVEKPKVKKVAKPKAKPVVKAEVKVEVKEEQAAPAVAAKPTPKTRTAAKTTRAKSTRTRSTRTKKVDK